MNEHRDSAFWPISAGAVRPASAEDDDRPDAEAVSRPPRAVDVPTTALFVLVSLTGLIAVPLSGYVDGYKWLDWVLFGILDVVSGLGITVGYHRLNAHGSVQYPDWVKAALLVAGSWVLENSALRNGAPIMLGTMRAWTRRRIPTTRREDSVTAIVAGSSRKARFGPNDTRPGCERTAW